LERLTHVLSAWLRALIVFGGLSALDWRIGALAGLAIAVLATVVALMRGQPADALILDIAAVVFLAVVAAVGFLDAVAAKIDGYATLHDATGLGHTVLFWLSTPGREASLRHVLAQAPRRHLRRLQVATSSGGTTQHPAGPVWAPLSVTHNGARARLADLSTAPPTPPQRQPERHRGITVHRWQRGTRSRPGPQVTGAAEGHSRAD